MKATKNHFNLAHVAQDLKDLFLPRNQLKDSKSHSESMTQSTVSQKIMQVLWRKGSVLVGMTKTWVVKVKYTLLILKRGLKGSIAHSWQAKKSYILNKNSKYQRPTCWFHHSTQSHKKLRNWTKVLHRLKKLSKSRVNSKIWLSRSIKSSTILNMYLKTDKSVSRKMKLDKMAFNVVNRTHKRILFWTWNV